ncbi:DNA-binding transcriptional repressor DeoR [Conservatibacter flavescens]|uniref:DNA-binding transcriptional repressor DeoR n=1 Tax=Conservatibacter flavescens TaxID=28161 RepID=A0A2M8S4C3_9PAST|nr:DNA-binding transcriptional repressor DeoR [Conservatibacter flavescens]PJG85995.1 DNA-binding transcriptional repressor DeoR [Conservatibacter flavescens]
MDNKVSARIQKLEFLLKQMDKIHLRDAAEILNVSEMTIRRDLNQQNSALVLLGGYIVKDSQHVNPHNYFILEQQTKHIAEKMEIGKKAAALVEENDIIFFDCGSTIPFIASQIPNDIKFTAVCCSINTFMILQEKSQCDVILCGGQYSRSNSFFSPISVANELKSICTSKAFISAAGVDEKHGVTCFNFDEVKIKHQAMAKAKQTILVFDQSKINKVQKAYIGELDEFDVVISQ